jgi:phospholipid-binding lipoprotein MlaA
MTRHPSPCTFRLVPAFSRAIALSLLLFAAACASVPNPSDTEAYAEYEQRNDPLEPLNRGVFAFNDAVDAMVLRPAAGFYRGLTPPPLQTGVNNFLRNLNTPVILANDLLQGQFDNAGITLARFFINTIGGVGGLYDLAADFDLDYHSDDFGLTLGVWGVPEGPYLVLPVIGPSNPRDAFGRAVDSFVFDPIAWWVRANPDDRQQWSFLRYGMTAVNERSRNYDELEDIRRTSLDPYASIRSLYQQYRRGRVNQERGEAETIPGPTMDESDGDAPPPAASGPAQ